MNALLSLATASPAADNATTFLALFIGEVLAWAGVPAIGAASAATAGALASQGEIHLWAVIVVGTIGAEIGAMIGWWIGRGVTRRTLDRSDVSDAPASAESSADPGRREKALEAGRVVSEKWGPLIVFFVPSWIPGGLGMQFRSFIKWNLLACLLWNAGAALSAYGIGTAASGRSLSNVLVPLVVGVLCIAAVALLTRAFFRRQHERRASAA